MDEKLEVAIDGIIAEWSLTMGCSFEYMKPPVEVWGTIQDGQDVMHMGVVIQCKHIRCYFEPSLKAMNTIKGAIGKYFDSFDHVKGEPKVLDIVEEEDDGPTKPV